jgi:hypothetical protein
VLCDKALLLNQPTHATFLCTCLLPLQLLKDKLQLQITFNAAVHTCGATNNDAIHAIGYLQLNEPVICTQVKLAIGQVPVNNTCKQTSSFSMADDDENEHSWE